jgi:hypothetical protein
VESILAIAEVRPRLRVVGQDGKRVPGTEIVFFENGAAEHVAVFRNPQFDAEGLGDYAGWRKGESGEDVDNSCFESSVEVTLEFADSRATYDIRHRSDLGFLKQYQCTLDPWHPVLLTRSSQPLPHLRITAPQKVSAGGHLELRVTTEGPAAGALVRPVQLEFARPDGRAYDLYTRSCLLRGESRLEVIPLAWNDPHGRWRAHAHDVATGQTLEEEFEVV